MCIIVVKKKGQEMPSKETLKNCCTRNPDGFGYALAVDGKLRIVKGYFDFNVFYNALQEAIGGRDPKDVALVIHARIATQGGVSGRLCHPFPLSSNGKELSAEVVMSCNVAVAHNGCISTVKYPDIKSEKDSDTYLFIKKYLSTYEKGWFKKNKYLAWLKEETGSKWAFLTKQGDVFMTDNFIEKDGIYYSNYSYEPQRFTYDYWSSSLNPTWGGWTKQSSGVGTTSTTKGFTASLPWEDRWHRYNEVIGYRGVLKIKNMAKEMNLTTSEMMSILDTTADIIDERVNRLMETEILNY